MWWTSGVTWYTSGRNPETLALYSPSPNSRNFSILHAEALHTLGDPLQP